MTIDECLTILTALKDGKKIQARAHSRPSDEWNAWVGAPNFYDFDYRIVKEPLRFTIFRPPGMKTLYAIPYDNYLPPGATLICTAIEEPLPTSDELQFFVNDVNKILEAKQTVAKSA